MRDSGQLTFTTMGGDTVTVPVRGKHYIEPRGYNQPPGTGPAGETCGTCAYIVGGRRWHKCDLSRARWTHSRGTDVLVKAPACRKWSATDERTIEQPTAERVDEFQRTDLTNAKGEPNG